MSEWKYIDSIAELSVAIQEIFIWLLMILQPWKVLNKFLKKNRIIVEQKNTRIGITDS